MPERGENQAHMNKLVSDLLGEYCKESNIQLGQITEDSSDEHENSTPLRKQEQAVNKVKKEMVAKAKEKQKQKEKEKAKEKRKLVP